MADFLAAARALKKQNANTTTTSTVTKTASSSVENPFNLEEIFKADIDRFGKLKEVLQYIFEQLNSNKSEVHRVDVKMQSKFMEISK